MSDAQSFDAGTPPAQRFARLSSPAPSTPSPPDHQFVLLSGFPASGKTAFLQSCPDAFILNLDRKELPAGAPARAGIWPTKSHSGETLDVDGQPFVLEWPAIEAKITALEQLAASGEERPSLVVFDTIAGALDLVQHHMMKQARVSTWDGLGDGRRSWDRAYTSLIEPMVRLRNVGYGVYITCHLTERTVKAGDTERRITETTISDGLWKRLSWRADMALGIVREIKPVTESFTEEVGGRTRTRTRTANKPVHILTVERPNLIAANVVRSPLTFPDVELSESSGWSDFTTAYTNAVTQES